MDEEHPFPPRIIQQWIRRKGVNIEHLVAELRYWADYMEGK